MTTEQTTLVAVYGSYATAQKAKTDLIDAGFSTQNVQVTSNDGGESIRTGSNGTTYGTEHHEGGISGFFKNLFGGHDETTDESGYYTEAVSRGSAVLTVTVDDSKVDSATAILDRYNPVESDQQVAQFAQTGKATKSSGDQVIPVVQEEMQVGKRAVSRGGVRVYSRVTETPVSESVSLHEERARVERHAVNRPATEADFQMKDEVVEVIETSEEAVVGKTARVVEEVVVGKEASDRTQTISDTVRRTDVEVERISPEVEQAFRNDFQTNYASSGSFDLYEPAYGYGYSLRNDPRYAGKNWSDVESSAKSDYLRANPNSTWDKVSNAVKYGWDKTTGKH